MIWRAGLALSLSAALSGCALFGLAGGRDVILPGERVTLEGEPVTTGVAVNRALPLSLPAARANADWTHRAGDAEHNIGHVALAGGLAPLWQTDIGTGNSRRARITADPIVAGGRIFTIDSAGMVQATSTGGARLWRTGLVPLLDNPTDASGGGLAYGAGRVFATSGFGRLSALDPETGAVLWTQDLDAQGGSAPTVRGDLVYISARDSRAWAIDVETGRIRYTIEGAPNLVTFGGGPGVAVTDTLAIIPFETGQVTATFRQGGLQRWSSSIAGERLGNVAAASVQDISGDPVISDGRIYVGNPSGRLAALDLNSGERIWTATEGALSPVVPAGGSIFLVSDLNELVRLSATDGSRIWGVQLPDRIVRTSPFARARGYANYGPVLASGRLIVASSDDMIRVFDPVSGALTATVALPGGAASNPAVAGGTLYVVTGDGTLAAYR